MIRREGDEGLQQAVALAGSGKLENSNSKCELWSAKSAKKNLIKK